MPAALQIFNSTQNVYFGGNIKWPYNKMVLKVEESLYTNSRQKTLAWNNKNMDAIFHF